MEEDEALPAGWRVAQDTKGRTYYYNKQLNLKQWGRPQPPIRGFHRQASAREHSPMRQPPAIPHWGLDETTEPGLADALRPLVRELRPRLLWALADGHRQQLELVWPELGRCYRPPPPDGDFATAARLESRARQQLAQAGGIESPQLSAFLSVARGDAAGPGNSWQQSWVRLSGGCVRIDRLQSDDGSPGVSLTLGPRWRVEEVVLPASVGAGSQSPGAAGFKLWERRDDGAAAVCPFYFFTPQNLKRWVLDLRTAALANARAALSLEQRLVEQAFQLALEGLSKTWPLVCDHLGRCGTLSGAETAWEVCAAVAAQSSAAQSDSPGVAALAQQLWGSVQADAASVQRRAAALDRESSRQSVVDKQDALVAAVRESLTPHADEALKGQVASELQVALAGLVQPLASAWADVAPHATVLEKLVRSLGGSESLEPQACFAFRDAVFSALDGLRRQAAAGDPDGGETAKLLRMELLPAVVLAMRAACSYLPFTDVLRAAERARIEALGIDVELENNPGLLVSNPGILAPLPEESPSDGRGGPSRTDSGSVPELSSSLQSNAVDQACRLARLVSLCQAGSLVGAAGQPARLQVQHLARIAVGALASAAGSFALALEESWRSSVERGYSPTDAYMELDGARSARVAQAAAEAASEAALEAMQKALSLLVSRWMEQLVADVASSVLARRVAPAVAQLAEQVASSNSSLEQHLLHGFGDEVTASREFGTEFVKAVLRDIIEVAWHSQISMFQEDLVQSAKALADVRRGRKAALELREQHSPLGPAHEQRRNYQRTLAEEWRVANDQHGRPYFWNRYTNETRWADPRPWLANATKVVFSDHGPLAFAVEARQEKSSLQDWMQVTRVDSGGQADKLGVVVGLMLYQVQGVAVPGLDRKSVVELFTDLRPLTAVFVQRDDGDFDHAAQRPAGTDGSVGIDSSGLDASDEDEPIETAGPAASPAREEVVSPPPEPLQTFVGVRSHVNTEQQRPRSSKRSLKCCCGSRPASSPPRGQRATTGDSSALAQLGHLVPPTPAAVRSASPARSGAAESSVALVTASPSGTNTLSRARAATEKAREAEGAAGNEAALKHAAEEAASKVLAVVAAQAVAAAAELTKAAENAEATVAGLAALLRKHPLLPITDPGGGSPQQPLRDARKAVESRMRSIEQTEKEAEKASHALARALWETDLGEIEKVLNAYKALSHKNARVQQHWAALKERYDEYNAEQQEILAALQSTQVIQQAILSDDVAAMLEVLEDHRGYDHPDVESAWQELREKVEARQQQQQQQNEEEDESEQQGELDEPESGEQANVIADGFDDAGDARAAAVEAEVAARRAQRESRRRALHARHSSQAGSGTVQHQPRSAKARVRAELQAALRSNDVDQMVRALAQHQHRALQPNDEAEHQALLQQLQQRVRAEADKRAEADARREARRAERKARLDKMKKDMMMNTPAHALKPPPDLVGFKQQQPQQQQPRAPPAQPESHTKSAVDDAGSRRAQQKSKHPDEAFLSRFDVKGSLGQGGFGEVLACWDNKLQRRVAVKVVRAAGGARYAWSASCQSLSRALFLTRRCAAVVSSRHARVL